MHRIPYLVAGEVGAGIVELSRSIVILTSNVDCEFEFKARRMDIDGWIRKDIATCYLLPAVSTSTGCVFLGVAMNY